MNSQPRLVYPYFCAFLQNWIRNVCFRKQTARKFPTKLGVMSQHC